VDETMEEAREIYELIHEVEPAIEKEDKSGGIGNEGGKTEDVLPADGTEDVVEPRKRNCDGE